MPLIYTFCTWFSVRLGSIIVALISLAQGISMVLFGIISYMQVDTVLNVIRSMLHNNDMLNYTDQFIFIEQNLEQCVTIYIAYTIIYIVACFLLIYGAFQLNISMILPYVICETARLLGCIYIHIAVSSLIKRNVLDFNILIMFLTCGVFILLLLSYLWLCPISLIQCILVVNSRTNKRKPKTKLIAVLEKPKIWEEKNLEADMMLQYYDYLSRDFRMKPMQPNRNYYQYQYRNLPDITF